MTQTLGSVIRGVTAVVLGLATATLIARAGVAQVLPVGSEFQVNSFTRDPQLLAQVAAAASGDFVVVWMSGAFSGGAQQDGSHEGIFAQRYTSAGARVGTEFQVNSYTFQHQTRAAVASDPDGNFVVAWQSVNFYGPGQDGAGYGVFAQRYASSGLPLGSEFQVNAFTSSDQRHAAVAVRPDGDFLVVWESSRDGASSGVFGQRFTSGGDRAGGEFQVNTYTPDTQAYPAVAVDAAGGFVVAWQSRAQDGSNYGVFGRRYDSLTVPLGSEFQINA